MSTRRGLAPFEEAPEALSTQPMTLPDRSRHLGQRDLEHGLCDIDTRLCSLHVDFLPPFLAFGAVVVPGTLVPSGGGVHPIAAVA